MSQPEPILGNAHFHIVATHPFEDLLGGIFRLHCSKVAGNAEPDVLLHLIRYNERINVSQRHPNGFRELARPQLFHRGLEQPVHGELGHCQRCLVLDSRAACHRGQHDYVAIVPLLHSRQHSVDDLKDNRVLWLFFFYNLIEFQFDIYPKVRHDAHVNCVLDRGRIVRVGAWTRHSAAVQQHGDWRDFPLNRLYCSAHLLFAGDVAGVCKGPPSPVNADLLHGALIADRVHIHADDSGPEQAQLNRKGLTDAPARPDNLIIS